jgi:hypothetical protein
MFEEIEPGWGGFDSGKIPNADSAGRASSAGSSEKKKR